VQRPILLLTIREGDANNAFISIMLMHALMRLRHAAIRQVEVNGMMIMSHA